MHVQHEIVEVVCVQSERSRRLVEDIPFPFLSRTAGWRVGTGYFHPVMKPNDPLRWNVCLTVIRRNVFEFLDYVLDFVVTIQKKRGRRVEPLSVEAIGWKIFRT